MTVKKSGIVVRPASKINTAAFHAAEVEARVAIQESIPVAVAQAKPHDEAFLVELLSGKWDSNLPFIEAFYAASMKSGYRLTGRSIGLFVKARKNANGRK